MAAAKKPKPSDKGESKKMNDVAKPGTTTPDASSRPIIVTNRPILQDPMMVDSSSSTAGTAEEQVAPPPTNTKKTIRPISVITDEDDSGTVSDAVSEADTVNVVKVTRKSAKKTAETVPLEAALAETVAATDASGETADQVDAQPASEPADTTVPEAESSEPAEETQAEESSDETDDTAKAQSPEDIDAAAKEAEKQAAEHTAAIEQLAESKTYYLPIKTEEQRKSLRFILLGAVLIVLLGAAWLDVALDAGLIQVGSVKPVTHFFAHQVAAPAAQTPATPKVTFTTFTAPISQVSFRYPSDWQLDSASSTAQTDTVNLQPKTVQPKPPGGINAIFLSLPVANPQVTSTLKTVHYQKLTHEIDGKTVYLVDLIYQDAAGNIHMTSSLTNDNSLKAGQKTADLQQNFINASGKANFFGINIPTVNSGISRFESLEGAQFFLTSHQYQQARAILLSTMPAKS